MSTDLGATPDRTCDLEHCKLLAAARAVLAFPDFASAARVIFDNCKDLTGAQAGYVALLKADGSENEVLFLDAGGMPCTVDPNLPMPIRGLRAEAYRTRRAVYENGFSASPWMKFMPPGHARLDNVLFAPLVIDGTAVGLLGLANKPGGFTDADARLADSFGEIAAIALHKSRLWDAINRSNERYRALFENITSAVFVHAAGSGSHRSPFTEVNETACLLLGYTHEELTCLAPPDLHPTGRAADLAAVTQELRQTGLARFDGTIDAKDGRRIPIEGYSRLFGTGAEQSVMTVLIEVTERKSAQASLEWELEVSSVLAELGAVLAGSDRSLQEIAEVVLARAQSLTLSTHGFVTSIDPATRANVAHTLSRMMPSCTVVGEQKRIEFPIGLDGRYRSLWGHALNTGEAFFTNQPASHPASTGAPMGHVQVEAFLAAPAVMGGEVLGLIALANPLDTYTQRALDAVRRMADLFALAVQRHRDQEGLRLHQQHLEQMVSQRTEELTRSEESLRRAQSVAHVGSWYLDIFRNTLSWSEETYLIFGMAPGSTLTYEIFLAHVHPDDRPKVDAAWGAALRGHGYDIEHRVLVDGKVRWVRERAELEHGLDGRPFNAIGTVQDITERKAAEQDVIDLALQWQASFDALSDMVWLLGPDCRILRCNAASSTLLGRGPGEILGMHCYELMHGTKTNIPDCPVVCMRTSKHRETMELQISDRWFAVTVDPIFDSAGVVSGAVHIVSDITERVLAEHALRESEERFKQLAENVDEVFWMAEPDMSRMHYINRAYSAIWGQSTESLYTSGRSWTESIHPDDRVQVMSLIDTDFSSVNIEFRITRPDLSIRWVRLRSFPVKNQQGQVIRVVGIAADVTDFKKASEQAALRQKQLMQADKMASLGILVSGVAHEINNPNNLIMLNADVLGNMCKELMPVLDEHAGHHPDFTLGGLPYADMRAEFEPLLKGISEGSNRIRTIVQNLKDFVRVDLGDLNQIVHVNDVIGSTIFIIGNLIKKSTKHFDLRLGERLPHIRANGQQLEQVVINLLSNACQSLPDPSHGIWVSTSAAADGRTVQIVVGDEGSGIPPEDLPKVIDPFFTTKRDTGGTGLGLSVSYGIVQAHNGTITFQSKPGAGTTVTVTLPVSK